MPQRHPNPGAQQVAPKGFPGDGARRRSDPLLPRLPAPQLRASSGAGGSGSSRALGSDAGWWQAPRGKSSYFRNSLKKILLHQIPALGPLKRDHSQFTTVKKANQPHSPQAPKLKAVFTHSSSGEGSGPRRRCYPFRVRFADETLRDTALRYWERSCAVWQGSLENENGTATQSAASERVFRSVGRWLESLPKTLYSRAVEEATARPCLPTQEPQGHFSEDASVNSSLPFIPRATTQRQRGDLKTFLGTHSILEQGGKSPSSWSQKLESFLPSLVLHTVLKRGRPKGYQLLLPSTTPQRAQR
ncbi:hypothetical protein HPG69_011110 [Diceros bicornis minor]|uniref:DUF4685 domain-containing protein n=1 Tax=Diceros bicornis minor TaxID=77932 RepID=A0A7J7FJJ4_DICBM|nr:hypothetical protein HPG69_011110 [Diceros bicornis minor]